MKVMISRNERGRALIKTVDGLNLQDLTDASDDQIKAVTNLVWEIKGLFYALIKGKASDVLADLRYWRRQKLSATLVADLTANIPRDVVVSAQQQWLPNLASELTAPQGGNVQTQDETDPAVPPEFAVAPEFGASQPAPNNNEQTVEGGEVPSADGEDPAAINTDVAAAVTAGDQNEPCVEQPPSNEPEATTEETDSQSDTAAVEPEAIDEAISASEDDPAEAEGRLPLPVGTPRAIRARKDAEKKTSAEEPVTTAAKSDKGEAVLCGDAQPGTDAEAQTAEATAETESKKANADDGENAPSANSQSPENNAEQFDDLLFPTKESAPASNPGEGGGEANPDGTASPDVNAGATADADAPAGTPADPETETAQPVVSIESDSAPEDWADYGGWYRQDFGIFYRPIGHKDKFNYSWLSLTGPLAKNGDSSPAAAVFEYLTNKDAQGSCTKCHSVDDNKGKGRLVNFAQASVNNKQGRLTNFIHEPHLGIVGTGTGSQENSGCLTCHKLEKGRPYVKSYEQGNPLNFASEFGTVKNELCQTCHTKNVARQDCLLCHKYHIDGVVTPAMSTKIPIQ